MMMMVKVVVVVVVSYSLRRKEGTVKGGRLGERGKTEQIAGATYHLFSHSMRWGRLPRNDLVLDSAFP